MYILISDKLKQILRSIRIKHLIECNICVFQPPQPRFRVSRAAKRWILFYLKSLLIRIFRGDSLSTDINTMDT